MAHVAIGAHLEQRWVAVLACPLDRAPHGVVHGEHIHPVDQLRGHIVAARMLDNIGHRRDTLEGGPHAVAIVLAKENDRQFPHRCHVQRLVKCSNVDRGFAEETDAYFVVALVLAGEGETRGQRDVSSNNSMAAHEAALDVEQVHRAALALRATGGLAEQLRHYGFRRDALDERLPMFAVGTDDVVVVPQRCERTDRDCFLADVEVAEAADLTEGICFRRLFLKATDQQHLPQHLEMQLALCRVLGTAGGGRHDVAASTCSHA